ncbi:MAG TPA: TetR/AcrR family transcriptional regulator [Candidatus Deferrimicrobiaceae bacterium]|nr:TetR/AcrR family transcriptional regulator [Candidatus Deferrimicrobiaceae bacterium]
MTSELAPPAGSVTAPRPREADLLAAATRLFRQRGFHATSMQDLGQALAMNRGSLYHYIAAKDDLLWTILTRAFDRLEARVVPVLSSDAPPLDRLRGAIHEHLRVAATHPDELSLIQIELRSLAPERRAEMIRRRDAYEARWRAAIADAVAGGALRGFDVRLAGIGILSACNWFTQWYRPDGDLEVDDIADRFCDLFLVGLLPREDLPRATGSGRP